MADAIAKKLQLVDELLEREYDVGERYRGEPLDVLIETILSQNTNDENSGRAYDAMRAAFPTWEQVMRAPRAALERALRPGGLAHTKAVRIQKLLRALDRRGGLNLNFLRGLSDADAEKALLAFDGVGLKTARCTLLFGLGRNVFPIDTHILRILKRLDILLPGMTAEQAHACLAPHIPPGRAYPLHVNLIAHGRTTCHARKPECGDCVLKRLCAARGMLTSS